MIARLDHLRNHPGVFRHLTGLSVAAFDTLAAGGVVAAGWLAVAGWRGYVALRKDVAGLDYLALGLFLFPVAVLVSLAKAGVLGRWVAAWRRPPG